MRARHPRHAVRSPCPRRTPRGASGGGGVVRPPSSPTRATTGGPLAPSCDDGRASCDDWQAPRRLPPCGRVLVFSSSCAFSGGCVCVCTCLVVPVCFAKRLSARCPSQAALPERRRHRRFAIETHQGPPRAFRDLPRAPKGLSRPSGGFQAHSEAFQMRPRTFQDHRAAANRVPGPSMTFDSC